jgi:hypothetical protein
MAGMRLPLNPLRGLVSRENRWAIALFLIIVLVIILTADSAPLWIYQGF